MTCILYVMAFSCVLHQHFEAFEFIFDIMYRQCNRQPTHWTERISITAKEDARKMANQTRTKRYNENSEEWKCQRRTLMQHIWLPLSLLSFSLHIFHLFSAAVVVVVRFLISENIINSIQNLCYCIVRTINSQFTIDCVVIKFLTTIYLLKISSFYHCRHAFSIHGPRCQL